MKQERNYEQISNKFLRTFYWTQIGIKTCKTHTYSISVKQFLVSIILYNGFSINDINDFFVQNIGLLVVVVFLKNYFLWKILNIFVQSTW